MTHGLSSFLHWFVEQMFEITSPLKHSVSLSISLQKFGVLWILYLGIILRPKTFPLIFDDMKICCIIPAGCQRSYCAKYNKYPPVPFENIWGKFVLLKMIIPLSFEKTLTVKWMFSVLFLTARQKSRCPESFEMVLLFLWLDKLSMSQKETLEQNQNQYPRTNSKVSQVNFAQCLRY